MRLLLIKLDMFLLKSSAPVGRGIAYLMDRSPIECSRLVAGIGAIIVGVSFSIDINPFGFDISATILWTLITAFWIWTFHRLHGILVEVRDEALEGRVPIEVIARLLDAGLYSRSFLIALIIMNLLFSFISMSPKYPIISIGYTLVLLAEYMLWMWDPPKKSLKKSIKSLLESTSFVPSPIR